MIARISVVSSMIDYKGIPVLLQALANVVSCRPEFEVNIVGDGPKRDLYMQMARELRIEDRIKFHGRLPKQVVAQMMRESDFLVQPSLIETFSVVVVEALACGIPVVATNVGAIPSLVNSNCGRLVPAQDSEALAREIVYMIDHHGDFAAEEISTSVRDKFSPEAVGKKLDEIYRSLVKT